MNDKLMDSYLDNIAEQVVDEDRIVTYKSLSRSLGIHVNTAKQLLYTYLTNEKSKNAFPISATYLVAGKVVDGSFNICIVNEADLKNAYSNFVEVTSEHVYSVQKGKTLKDLNSLCGIEKEASTLESSKLVIKCSKATSKSSEVKKKIQSYEKNNEKIIKQAFLSEKEVIKVKEVNAEEKKVETPAAKDSSSKSPKKPSPKGNQQKAKGNLKKPTGNIANLFAKAAQKTTAKANATEKTDKKTSIEETKENENVDVIDEINEVESKKPRVELEKGSESKEKVKKKKGNKRKRIQMLSDSEEDDESNEEEDEKIDPIEDDDDDILPCSLNLEEEKEESKDFIPKNKRKKRKVIDKTVMHEDGYLETKKEVVFETDSENEEDSTTLKEQRKPKPAELNDKGKAVQGTAAVKKQSSLLTFFKKS